MIPFGEPFDPAELDRPGEADDGDGQPEAALPVRERPACRPVPVRRARQR